VNDCPFIVAVEVLEPFTSRWMFYELKHLLSVVPGGCIRIFNVKDDCEVSVLREYFGYVARESVKDYDALREYDEVIVLDPQATTPLSPVDFVGKVFLVVGGIMGSHPPSGRTRRELTSKLPLGEARNIGPGQFTIDGAVYVASEVYRGLRIDEVPTVDGLTLRGKGFEVFLPYRYPLKSGAPFISEEEKKYILEELEEDEYLFIAEGVPPSICAHPHR
jgi:ribosome biogenesis SPOUT family RNA methylase Rps3